MPLSAPAPSPENGLPEGFGVAWDRSVQRHDGGRLLVGGVPRRVVRLSESARQLLDRLAGPQPPPVDPVVARSLVRPLLDAGLLHPVPGPDRRALYQVTVVVPVRDGVRGLTRLLPALAGTAAVIVVDDGSRDGSGEVAAALGAQVIRHESPRGPASARNTGLAAVRTPLVAFVDSDVVLEPGWAQALLGQLRDPAVAVVAPRIVGEEGRSDRLARYEVARSPLDLGPHPGYVRPGNRVSFVPAAVLLARTEVVREGGGFDAALGVGEDVDLIWRLAAAGWRVRYDPSVTVRHEARPDLRRFLARRVDYGTSAALLHQRHPGKVAPLRLSPWSAAVWTAALAGRLRLSWALGGVTVARLARSLRGRTGDPLGVAWDVAGVGHLGAVRLIASALARTWLPPALLAMAASRRGRRAVGGMLLLGIAADWLERRPRLDPPTYLALHLADDAAYCAGVWIGCARAGNWGALVPRRYRPEPLLPVGGAANEAVPPLSAAGTSGR